MEAIVRDLDNIAELMDQPETGDTSASSSEEAKPGEELWLVQDATRTRPGWIRQPSIWVTE